MGGSLLPPGPCSGTPVAVSPQHWVTAWAQITPAVRIFLRLLNYLNFVFPNSKMDIHIVTLLSSFLRVPLTVTPLMWGGSVPAQERLGLPLHGLPTRRLPALPAPRL